MVANSIVPALNELERAFFEFEPLFPRDMPLPVITIQSNGRSRDALGWFWDKKWQNGESGLPEINISAEYLSRGVEEVAETLLHEMVHYCNALLGIRDCGSSGYHNRHFRYLCNRVGLNAERYRHRGWSQTSLSPQLCEKVNQATLNPDVFRCFRRDQKTKSVGSKLKLWQCACGTRVRVAVPEFHATCLVCQEAFVCQS